MKTLVPFLITTAFIGLISTLSIWIVSNLSLGLEVNGFGSALAAGYVIAFVAGMIIVLLNMLGIGDGDDLIGVIVHLITTAVALMVGSRMLPSLQVASFKGALVAAVTIGASF